ncbi:dihydrolipoamide acetyltransferase family protein [Streptomonospora litoralis]|uniref:Dihydrolipoamide acetyltransferase component of pyruvate dehydrogenase complex n=1 Tax=Streptomonospora litoralis TaxID=2498135 RepID=A0A4P6Q894_9ACTN|nr:dihydrolipoamide acetyltransferase family protein [Streptomonospora litoralis]QBI56650.1 Dihydrolipoyllysine-residue acetyltransferase component of pyruvate dehydrogenase complex [Streptomonospora litoralis]
MTEIYMPRLSDTMEEGVISSWVKNVGDEVSTGDVLVEIETDKAVMEHEAYADGYLIKQAVSEGDTVPIGAVIAYVGESPDEAPPEGESASGGAAPAQEESAEQPAAQAEEQPARETAPQQTEAPQQPASSGPDGSPGTRPRSSPLARRLAREYGLDIESINGSGPKGRIVRADIEAAAQQRPAEPAPAAAAPQAAASGVGAPAQESYDDGRDSAELSVSNVRKVIARRLVQSKQEAPHFYLRRTIDAEGLKDFRSQINAQLEETGNKVSFNDLIVKACATTLRTHPEVNRSWVNEKLLQHNRINVGVAVAVEAGLIVPVLHDTDRMPLSEIGERSRELAGRARDGKLKPQEMSGGTFSVSNLGMYGMDSFSAVINPPEAAILAVGAMKQQPVVRDGEVVARNTMSLELSVDHRAVDGAVGAAFLKDLAEVLENPVRIVV